LSGFRGGALRGGALEWRRRQRAVGGPFSCLAGALFLFGLFAGYRLALLAPDAPSAPTDMAAAKPQAGAGAGAGVALERFHFEVSGKVQGVFFRKHAAEQAARLGLTGWVQNTQRGTVVGEAEGAPAAMRDLCVVQSAAPLLTCTRARTR
jgi:acylphosphatase